MHIEMGKFHHKNVLTVIEVRTFFIKYLILYHLCVNIIKSKCLKYVSEAFKKTSIYACYRLPNHLTFNQVVRGSNPRCFTSQNAGNPLFVRVSGLFL